MSTQVVEYDTAAAERRAERIRLRLDSIADGVTAVLPMIREAIEKGDPDALGYRSVGEYVADRFGGALGRLPADLRRPVVHELHAAGMSTRAIAPVVGVSHVAVAADLNAGVKDLTPEHAVDRDTGEILTSVEPAASGDDAKDATGRERVEVPSSPPPRRPVVGIDGKTYRPVPPAPINPERQREAEIERGRADTCRAVSEAVRSLNGGAQYAAIFLSGFYPHEARHLAEGERLTPSGIDGAIEFLTTIRKAIQ